MANRSAEVLTLRDWVPGCAMVAVLIGLVDGRLVRELAYSSKIRVTAEVRDVQALRCVESSVV